MTIKRDAYAEGREAHHAGKSETENPFDLGEEEDKYLAWSDGWIEAALKEGKRVAREGREAYHAGKSEAENPFDLGEEEDKYLAWSDGWIEAAEEDEKEN